MSRTIVSELWLATELSENYDKKKYLKKLRVYKKRIVHLARGRCAIVRTRIVLSAVELPDFG